MGAADREDPNPGAEIGAAGPGEITSMDASPRDTKPGRSGSRSAAKRPDQAAPGGEQEVEAPVSTRNR